MLLATDGCHSPQALEQLMRLLVTQPPLIKLKISHLFVTAAQLHLQGYGRPSVHKSMRCLNCCYTPILKNLCAYYG